jgi:hypothetical protein
VRPGRSLQRTTDADADADADASPRSAPTPSRGYAFPLSAVPSGRGCVSFWGARSEGCTDHAAEVNMTGGTWDDKGNKGKAKMGRPKGMPRVPR